MRLEKKKKKRKKNKGNTENEKIRKRRQKKVKGMNVKDKKKLFHDIGKSFIYHIPSGPDNHSPPQLPVVF